MEIMEETYLPLMVVVVDLCMVTWVNHVDQIQIVRLNILKSLLCLLLTHNTSYFFKREDGTYYWLHCRKGKDDLYVDADEMQLDLLGNDPILSTEYIMKSIYY